MPQHSVAPCPLASLHVCGHSQLHGEEAASERVRGPSAVKKTRFNGFGLERLPSICKYLAPQAPPPHQPTSPPAHHPTTPPPHPPPPPPPPPPPRRQAVAEDGAAKSFVVEDDLCEIQKCLGKAAKANLDTATKGGEEGELEKALQEGVDLRSKWGQRFSRSVEGKSAEYKAMTTKDKCQLRKDWVTTSCGTSSAAGRTRKASTASTSPAAPMCRSAAYSLLRVARTTRRRWSARANTRRSALRCKACATHHPLPTA